MTPSSLFPTREDALLVPILIFTCLSLEMRWILMRMCLYQPWAPWYLDSETVCCLIFVSLYNQCTYLFFVWWFVVCYCIIVYLLLIRSTKESRGPESWSKQAKVWMVVARRNIKSTGIGIRETSGGSEMTGSNEWLIHKWTASPTGTIRQQGSLAFLYLIVAMGHGLVSVDYYRLV